MNRSTEKIIILFGCLCLMGAMWWDLGRKVESGKPFQLNDKWYQAREVAKP